MAILGQVMGYRGVAEGLPGREGYRTIPGREWVVTGPDGSTGRRVVDLWQIATALGLTSLTIVAPPGTILCPPGKRVCPGRYGIVVGSRVRGRSRDARPCVVLLCSVFT